MSLAQANNVTAVVACAVTDYYHGRAVRRVRRIVEDAGGEFTGLVAPTARARAQYGGGR